MADENGKEGAAPTNDAFGEPVKPVEAPPAKVEEAAAPEEKFVEVDGKKFIDDGTGKAKVGEDGQPVPFVEKKAAAEGGDDIENNPVVVALKNQVEEVKSSLGGNLSAQREIIDTLTKELKAIREGKDPNTVEPLFKDVKRVKDLSAEEQEKMTDTEKRLFDELADTRDMMNKNHAASQTKEKEAADQAAKDAKDAMATVVKTAQAEALRLAGGKKDMANQIIENFNLFKDNEKLSEEQVKERVVKASQMVKGFTPVKEQKTVTGKPVASGKVEDPHNIQHIVDGIGKNKGGTYAL